MIGQSSPGGTTRLGWAGLAQRLKGGAIILGGLLIANLIVSFIFTVLTPPDTFASFANGLTMLRSMSSTAMLALGLLLVIIVGEIDLSFGFVYGFVGTLVAVAWTVWQWPIWAAILLGIAAAISIGAVNAAITTFLRIPSFIVTLGSGTLVNGLTLLIGNTANFSISGSNLPKGEVDFFVGISNQDLPGQVPMQGLWLILAAIIFGFLLARSLFGFRLRAIGGNPVAAGIARLPVRRYKFAAFILCSLMACFASLLDFSFIQSTQPTSGQGFLFPVFAAVIIGGASLAGGRGTVIGTLLGALLLTILQNGFALLATAPWVSQVFLGSVTILAVLLDGITQRRQR